MDSTESINSSVVDEDENDNTSEFRRESSFREDTSSKRITWDGVMIAPPVIIEDENVKLEDATIESARLKIESVATPLELSNNEALLSYYNTRALSKDAKTYELEKFQKNALLIFNQVHIDGYKKPREGTEKDVDALEATFRKYGFEVFVRTDYKLNEIREELRNFSQKNYTEYGCVGVVVLTHGTNNGYLRAKDGKYSENEIINCFKAHDKRTLVSKPKIFIIQACRGAKLSPVVRVGEVSVSKLSKDLAEELEPYTLPVEADMLVFHSSYAGSPSIRDIEEGSWFIQSLCSKINQLAETEDLASIFTEVKREVAIDREHEELNRRTNEMEVNKQMPVVTTTLIRKLFLKRFGDEASHNLRLSQNLSPPKISMNEEMDYLSPTSPKIPQFDMCTCYLNHFDYLRDCLRYHTEANPQDSVALGLLATANTMTNMEAFNLTKQTLSRTICEHFKTNASTHDYFKYMYLIHKSHLHNS